MHIEHQDLIETDEMPQRNEIQNPSMTICDMIVVITFTLIWCYVAKFRFSTIPTRRLSGAIQDFIRSISIMSIRERVGVEPTGEARHPAHSF